METPTSAATAEPAASSATVIRRRSFIVGRPPEEGPTLSVGRLRKRRRARPTPRSRCAAGAPSPRRSHWRISPRDPSGLRDSAILLELRLHLALLHRPGERGMVALVLVRVGHGEGGNGLVEGVAAAHVPTKHQRLAGTRMGE